MSSPDPAPRSTSRLSRLRRPVLITVGIAALWTGIVGAWLPHWVRPHAEAAASEALGTPVSLRDIHVQPWTGVVRINGLAVGPAAAPLLKLQQAEVQLSLESVWRFAPVLRRVTLLKPEVWIERQSAQRFNFTPILDKLSASDKPTDPDAAPQRFAVFNIALQDGSVRYTDRVLAQEHRIDQVRIGVPFLSNLPSKVDVDVEPLLSARIDGSTLAIKGRTLPFHQGLKSELDVRFKALNVPYWLAAVHPFLPAEWRPDARSGRMDTAITIGFEARQPPAVPLLSIKGRVQIDKLGLAWKQAPLLGEADLNWGSLKIEGIDAAPLARQVALGKVSLDGVQWRSQLGVPPATGSQAQANTATIIDEDAKAVDASGQWAWRVDQLQVQTGRIDVQPVIQHKGKLADKVVSRWPMLDTLRIDVKGLNSSTGAVPATWQLDLQDEHGAAMRAKGQLQVAKQTMDAQLDLSALQLASWLAPLNRVLDLPLTLAQGELALQASLNARLTSGAAPDAEPAQAQLLSGRLSLKNINAHASQRGVKDQIRLASLTLDGMQARVDLADEPTLRQIGADSLHIAQLDAAVTRGPRGEWLGMAPSPAAPKAGDKPGKPDKPATRIDKAAMPLPDMALNTLRCEACQVHLTDQTVTPAAQFDLSKMDLRVAALSGKLSNPVQVALDTFAQGKGRLQFKGDVRPEPLSVQGRVQVAGLDLRAVQPYIDPWVNIRLAMAKAQADGVITLQAKPPQGGLSARYKGRAGLSELRVQDRVNEADFLRWQTLSLDGMDVQWADQMLDADLGRIALKDFYGRVIINPGGDLNLSAILRREGAEAASLTTPQVGEGMPKAPAHAASAANLANAGNKGVSGPASAATAASPSSISAPGPASAAPAPKLRWQQIQLAKGRIDFTDNFIKPNYSARLTQIEGEVSAVSSTRPEPATVKISGAVDDAAPLQITGQLHPLGPRLYTDIQGSAKGIELTRLTPYASRYAGYAIEKGSLSVTVQYKVDGGKLEASNRIFLDQLTFGEKTDSPDAIKLPVLLAVSLLQNSKGEIDINLPISGSLDDPEFSVGGIIWRVVVNLISKAVLAPFSLLSGGGTDELGLVAFEPGSARLSEAATQRLDTLATKLQDRPALKLEATGRADADVDEEGMRRVHVNRLMRAAKAKATGQPIAEVRIEDAERPSWLKAAYKDADIKKPRNIIGIAKTLSADEMEALLKASVVVDEAALRTLANRRGDVVKAYLATKLPPERVLLTASKLGAEGLPDDKAPTTRVQFAVK